MGEDVATSHHTEILGQLRRLVQCRPCGGQWKLKMSFVRSGRLVTIAAIRRAIASSSSSRSVFHGVRLLHPVESS